MPIVAGAADTLTASTMGGMGMETAVASLVGVVVVGYLAVISVRLEMRVRRVERRVRNLR